MALILRCKKSHAFGVVESSGSCYVECTKIVDCPKKQLEVQHVLNKFCFKPSTLDGIVFENMYCDDENMYSVEGDA